MVHHNVRKENGLANFLAKKERLLDLYNKDYILVAAPVCVRPILQANRNGETTNQSISISTCNKLAMLGNLNILCNGVDSIDANSITTGEANSLSTTNVVLF